MDNGKEGGATRLLAFILADMTADVAEFHREVVHVESPPTPRFLSPERHKWAVGFLQEELNEYKLAIETMDLPGAIDALVDLTYVAIGRLLEHGVPPSEAWDPVQRANMAKRLGQTHRGSDTDAAKPDGWMPPDHEALVKNLALRSAVCEVFLEATAVALQRGAAYNHAGGVRREDHFPFGMTSIFQMLHVKHMRMMADIQAGRTVDRDHLVDTINYARFGVDLLDGREMK